MFLYKKKKEVYVRLIIWQGNTWQCEYTTEEIICFINFMTQGIDQDKKFQKSQNPAYDILTMSEEPPFNSSLKVHDIYL